MTAIQQDAAMSTDMDVNDVENEFLKRITKDAEKPSKEAEVANEDTDDHEEPEEPEADDTNESDDSES